MHHEHQDTDRLAELIGAKLDILRQLRDKSRQQAELIRGHQIDRLMSVLSAKHIIVGELQKLEAALDPFREQVPEQRAWRSPEHRSQTKRLAEQCDSLLQESLLLDKQSESLLTQHRDDTANRLKGIQDASQAAQAYDLGGQDSDTRQLDVSS